jgi:hypothetical protein
MTHLNGFAGSQAMLACSGQRVETAEKQKHRDKLKGRSKRHFISGEGSGGKAIYC